MHPIRHLGGLSRAAVIRSGIALGSVVCGSRAAGIVASTVRPCIVTIAGYGFGVGLWERAGHLPGWNVRSCTFAVIRAIIEEYVWGKPA